jgi:hypothetical protein
MKTPRSPSALWLAPAILLTSIIPSAIYMVFQTSSLSTGTVLCGLLWIVLALGRNVAGIKWTAHVWRLFGAALLVLTLLFVHGLVVDLWLGGVNFGRLVGSSAILLIIALAAYVIALLLLESTPRNLSRIARFAFFVLTLLGFGAVAGLPSLGHLTSKPVVVFSEPSVFSFVYLPFLIFMVATTTRGRQLLYLGAAFALAAALQNLTLLIGVLGTSCLILRRTQIVILAAALAVALSFLTLDLSYYAGRLDLSGDSDNMSTLVYLQGWERAALNITETRGLGVGFQQFGYVGSLGTVLDRIAEMSNGAALNLYDGGSTGSKMIAELGIAGVVLLVLFLRLLARGFMLIRKAQRLPRAQRDVRRIFFFSFIIAYGSELLIRGNGYLSPSGTFILAALFAVHKLGVSEQPVPGAARATLPAQNPVSA